MFRVPKGTRVVLMRHAESEWNRERIEALNEGGLPPIRLPNKRDAGLSPYGRVQAYLAGCYLKWVMGVDGDPRPFDLALWSSYRRAQETYDVSVQAMGAIPRYRSQTIHLDEAREWLSDQYHTERSAQALVEQARPFLSAYSEGESAMQRLNVEMLSSFTDIVQHELKNETATGPQAQVKPTFDDLNRAASRASKIFGEAYVPVFLAWYLEQMSLPPQERRKTPEWERYEDIKDRASVIATDLRSYLYDDAACVRTALIVTHSKIAIALRELIEELSDEQVKIILTAEGPPFPPHVGMTFYRERDGLLVLDGDPYRLPPEIVLDGRHSRIAADVSRRRIGEICNAVGVRKVGAGYRFKYSVAQRINRGERINVLSAKDASGRKPFPAPSLDQSPSVHPRRKRG